MASGTISRILSGQVSPSLDSIEALAKGLGYSLESFILLILDANRNLSESQHP